MYHQLGLSYVLDIGVIHCFLCPCVLKNKDSANTHRMFVRMVDLSSS